MGFIGIEPPTQKVSSDGSTEQGRIAAQVDSSAVNLPGTIAFFKDSSGRISVLRYCQAQASVALGATLQHQAGGGSTLNSAGVSTLNGRAPYFVDTATTGVGGQNQFAGVAAAAVSNTGYFFWAYVGGYCPDVAFPTNYASGQPMRLSATYAGRLSSAAIQATVNANGTFTYHIVAKSLGAATVSTANSTNSAILLGGWL